MAESTEARQRSRRGVLRAAGGAVAIGAASSRGAAQASTTVDMTDSLEFQPANVQVAPGTTVVWENVGSIPHSVTAYEDEIPEGTSYWASGGFDSESAARGAYPGGGSIDGGGTYEHTFETEGEHGYFCIPHEASGMVGTVTVSQGAGGDEAVETGPPEVPDAALSLTTWLFTFMGLVLGLTFFILKYGGSDEEE